MAAKAPKGLHQHVVVLKGKVFLTEPACGPGHHSHLVKLGDDFAETGACAAAELQVRKSAGSEHVAVDHAHTFELFDGSTVETLLPGDVMNIHVRKELLIELCEIHFWKERFSEMAVAARWMDEQKQTWIEQSETPQFITFTVKKREEFQQASLRTVHLSDGVDAVIGIIATEDDKPVPEDDSGIEHPDEPSEPDTNTDPGAFDGQPDEDVFDEMRALVASGYEVLTEEQAKALGNLREEHAAALLEVHKGAAALLPHLIAAGVGQPEEAIDADVFLRACERAHGSVGALVAALPMVPGHTGIPTEEDIEKTAPTKWVGVSHSVPAAVAKAVRTGLAWRETHQRGGTPDILEWAEEVAKNATLPCETILRMRKQVERRRNSRGFDAKGAPVAGEITWRLLGGDAGERWIEKAAAEMDAEQAQVNAVVAAQASQLGAKASALAAVFEGSSFDVLATVLKSVGLTCEVLKRRRDDANLPTVKAEKALVPADTMSKADLESSIKQRSRRFGIEIVEDHALTFPKGMPTDLDLYGDPVNLKFPLDTVARARNARVRFKQFAPTLYSKEKSRAVVHERIVRAEVKFGIKPDFDPEDPLDALLPADLQEKLEQPVAKRAATPAPQAETTVTEIRWDVRILKAVATDDASEERTAFGIVLEPDVTDLHGDTYDEEVVRDAAWSFMEDFAETGLQHELIVTKKVRIIESWVAPVAMSIATDKGKVKIKKGTWLMRVRVLDDGLWEAVKNGKFTGFSFGGTARVLQLKKNEAVA